MLTSLEIKLTTLTETEIIFFKEIFYDGSMKMAYHL